MDYWGRTGGVSIVLPYLFVESSSSSDRTAVHGVSDIGFLWQMNIFGGPALSREAFASFVPQTFSSFHLFVGTPLGEYEPRRALNPSANRWTLRPTVNFSYTPDRGWTWLETYVSAVAFTPNDAFQAGGASRRNAADTLRLGAGMGARLWPGGDIVLNAESVVAKPESEPYAWGVRLTLRQFW